MDYAKSILVVVGTRPEIIKMSPIIRECEKRGLDFNILHTGQHYSYSMDKVFFEQLNLPEPSYKLEVGSGSHAVQTARILERSEQVLVKNRPAILLTEGDTNSVVASSLAAAKLSITTGHVEAGLRSYYRRMPEELNRIIADHISDYLFTPTVYSRDILLKEGISSNVYITGNTIVDAVNTNLSIANSKSSILRTLDLEKQGYLLLTLHRQENVDSKSALTNVFSALKDIYSSYNLPILFSVHPRTQKQISKFDLSPPNGIKTISPLGYLDFLQLEANARLILTDSGAIQEEACILSVPCVTLRDNTERPETIDVGANLLGGIDSKLILSAVEKMMTSNKSWCNPFGDGTAGKKILDIIEGH